MITNNRQSDSHTLTILLKERKEQAEKSLQNLLTTTRAQGEPNLAHALVCLAWLFATIDAVLMAGPATGPESKV